MDFGRTEDAMQSSKIVQRLAMKKAGVPTVMHGDKTGCPSDCPIIDIT
jgi:hypothetical protein